MVQAETQPALCTPHTPRQKSDSTLSKLSVTSHGAVTVSRCWEIYPVLVLSVECSSSQLNLGFLTASWALNSGKAQSYRLCIERILNMHALGLI